MVIDVRGPIIPDDFDRNEVSDIPWERDDGAVSIWDNGQISGAHIIGTGVPSSWHIAGTGDFAGDRKDDILWYNDNGSVSIWDHGDIAHAHIVSAAGVVGSDWHIV